MARRAGVGRIIAASTLVLVVLSVAGCRSTEPDPNRRRRRPTTIAAAETTTMPARGVLRIGLLAPTDTRWAQSAAESAVLAVAHLTEDARLPGWTIQLVRIDENGSGSALEDAVSQLKADAGVIGIVGPFSSAAADRVVSVLGDEPFPVITPTAMGNTAQDNQTNLFHVGLTRAQLVDSIVDSVSRAQGDGVASKPVVVVTAKGSDGLGASVTKALATSALGAQEPGIFELTTDTTPNEVDAVVRAFTGQAFESPGLVIVDTSAPKVAFQRIQTFRAAGVKAQLIAVGSSDTTPCEAVPAWAANDRCLDAHLSIGGSLAGKVFQEDRRASGTATVGPYDAATYDAVLALVGSVTTVLANQPDRSTPAPTPKSLRSDSLKNLRAIVANEGITGPLRWLADGSRIVSSGSART